MALNKISCWVYNKFLEAMPPYFFSCSMWAKKGLTIAIFEIEHCFTLGSAKVSCLRYDFCLSAKESSFYYIH